MKQQLIYTILLIMLISTGCVYKQRDIVISDTLPDLELRVDQPQKPTPPSQIKFSKSHSLNEALSAICKNEHPTATDTLYELTLYKMNDHFVIFFIDSNSSKDNAAESSSKNKRDFKDKYYQIKDTEFPDKDWLVVIPAIRNRFSEFSKTGEFKKSDLAKLKPLRIQFNDAVDLRIN